MSWPPPNIDWFYHDDFTAIACGDCREVLPKLPKVDCVVTDPPYGISFAAQPTTGQRKRGQKKEAWDDHVFTDINFIRSFADVQIIWGGNYYPLPPVRGWLTWFKPDAPPSMGSLEFAWTNLDKNSRQISHSIAATNAERVGHPTQKPLAVMLWAINQAPDDCQTILDPFMGSGTTLVAAKQLGRRAIGVEINRDYCQIAVDRLSQEYLPLVSEPKPTVQEVGLL